MQVQRVKASHKLYLARYMEMNKLVSNGGEQRIYFQLEGTTLTDWLNRKQKVLPPMARFSRNQHPLFPWGKSLRLKTKCLETGIYPNQMYETPLNFLFNYIPQRTNTNGTIFHMIFGLYWFNWLVAVLLIPFRATCRQCNTELKFGFWEC